jgi:hypothetical protein
MTGASYLVAGDRALHMRLPGNATRANRLSIELAPIDTYRLTFHRSATGQVRLLLCDDVYAEGLRSAFEHATNLATSLGKVSA